MSVLRPPSWKGLMFAALAALAVPAMAQEEAQEEAQEDQPLTLGDVVVTGFSGSAAEGNYPDEKTLINELGKSLRVLDIKSPGFPWDGRVWQPVEKRAIEAARIGQVFGVTLDDADPPNIYAAATSYYGLYIVGLDADGDGKPDRLMKGGALVKR